MALGAVDIADMLVESDSEEGNFMEVRLDNWLPKVAREKEKMESVRDMLREMKWESTLLDKEGESLGGTGGGLS